MCSPFLYCHTSMISGVPDLTPKTTKKTIFRRILFRIFFHFFAFFHDVCYNYGTKTSPVCLYASTDYKQVKLAFELQRNARLPPSQPCLVDFRPIFRFFGKYLKFRLRCCFGTLGIFIPFPSYASTLATYHPPPPPPPPSAATFLSDPPPPRKNSWLRHWFVLWVSV